MKLFKYPMVALTCFLLASTTALAAEVTVIWHNPGDFSDIRGGVTKRNHVYHVNKVFTTFENSFAKLASLLPENQKLYIKVLNVDLAGQAWGTTPQRIIQSGFYPRLLFTYILKDEGGKVIKENRVSLKDIHFFEGSNQFNLKFLAFEKRMLRKWFRKEFSEQLER